MGNYSWVFNKTTNILQVLDTGADMLRVLRRPRQLTRTWAHIPTSNYYISTASNWRGYEDNADSRPGYKYAGYLYNLTLVKKIQVCHQTTDIMLVLNKYSKYIISLLGVKRGVECIKSCLGWGGGQHLLTRNSIFWLTDRSLIQDSRISAIVLSV